MMSDDGVIVVSDEETIHTGLDAWVDEVLGLPAAGGYKIDGEMEEVYYRSGCLVCNIDQRFGRTGIRYRTAIDVKLISGRTPEVLYAELPEPLQDSFSSSALRRHRDVHVSKQIADNLQTMEANSFRDMEVVPDSGSETIISGMSGLATFVRQGGQKIIEGKMDCNTTNFLKASKLLHEIRRDTGVYDARLREARDAFVRIYEYGKEACADDLDPMHRMQRFTNRVQNDPYLRPVREGDGDANERTPHR